MGIFEGRIALAPAPALVRRPRSRSPNGARAWHASTDLAIKSYAVKQAKRGQVVKTNITPRVEPPCFVRKTGLRHWTRYAARDEEFVPIQTDVGAGKAAGFPSAIGTGDLPWRCLHNMLRGWMGEGGRIEKISATYQQPNITESTITAHGKIVSVTPAVVDLWAHDEKQVSGQATMKVKP